MEKVLALGHGVDYVSVLTPHYFGSLMDDSALIAYYEAVADRSPVPVLVYVAPGFANGVSVSPAAVKRLAEHPNIHGMKDTTPALLVSYMAAVGQRDDFSVMAGSLNTLLSCLTYGGVGGVVSAANYLPRQCVDIADLYFAGRLDEALQRYMELLAIVAQTGAKYSVAGLKSCMNVCGFSGGVPRLPVRALSLKREAEIRDIFERSKLIGAQV
jgi:4-hydroxy-2-oxoglutarate aldolase